MRTRSVLFGALVLTGCVQDSVALEPSQVLRSDVIATDYRVSGIAYADYLQARASHLRLREGVEVWIGAQQADIVDVDRDGIHVRLPESLALGQHDLRVHAASEYLAAAALHVVETAAQDGGLDATNVDVVRRDGASDDAATGDAATDDVGMDDAGIQDAAQDGPSLCVAACELANASARCRAGMCEIEECTAGFEDCDMQAVNGCEIDTQRAPEHCGACGRVCGAGEGCVEGTCAPVPSQVAAGARHTCAVRGGEVYCWGRNAKGELGSETPAVSMVPILVTGLTDALSVAAGEEFTCALQLAGTVSCWGSNARGALGDAGGDRPEPRAVEGIVGAHALSAGADFACAVLRTGEVRCWGHNDHGQLGTNDDADDAARVPVATITTAVDVACGDAHACAVLASGEVVCWGEGASGGLGNGDTEDAEAPVQVLRLNDVTTVSAGRRFSCATRAGSAGAVCWGEGSQGQLGNGLAVDSPTPVRVASISGAAQISAGYDFACYLLSSGDVHCWGKHSHGQLGTVAVVNLTAPPLLPVIGEALAVAAGEAHACALRNDGAIFCWGHNNEGQLGDGSAVDSPRPVQVLGL